MRISEDQLNLALRRLITMKVPLEACQDSWENMKNDLKKNWTSTSVWIEGSTSIYLSFFFSKDFVYLIMLASWVSLGLELDLGSGLDLVEYFAGVSRICRMASWRGYTSRGFEMKYDVPPSGFAKHSNMPHRSCFDFNGEAGFLYLDWV